MAREADFDDDRGGGPRRFVIYALIALALVAVGWFIYQQATSRQGVKIEAAPPTMIDMLPPPPPPPPPPPKPVEQPPEPSPDTPTPNPEPAKAPDAPAPMQIDGPAQAGTDSFGMTAGAGGGIGAPGGTGTCLGSNCGTGGGGGLSDASYRQYLSSALQQRVQDDDRVNRLVFTADLAITVSNGRITQVSLLRSSGRDDRDKELIRILQGARGLDPPPASFRFPQKITVRGRRAL